jgi:methyl-accepting chemotaxis protein
MAKMSIRFQLLLVVTLSIILLTVINTYIGVDSSKEALIEQKLNALKSINSLKKGQIEEFFQKVEADLKTLAHSKNVEELVAEVNSLDEKLNLDPKGGVPIESEIFKKFIEDHEEFFKNYAKENRYYDLFIIDAEDGHIIYTVAKESDFGANLLHSSLKSSPLAEVFQKSIQRGGVAFVDMKPYAPSYDLPSIFASTVVEIDGEVQAVLAFQLNDRLINEISLFRKGYGQTQEDYLVGSDNLMRSDSFLNKEFSTENSFEKGLKVNSEAIRDVFAGKSSEKIIVDYNGNSVLSAYDSIELDGFKWAIVSEIDEAEVLESINRLRNSLIIDAVAVLVIILVIINIILARVLIKPLDSFKERVLEIAREYNLTIRLNSNYPKELSDMAKSFNTLLDSLTDLLSDTKEISLGNSSTSASV